jgi:hypothetical protein
MNARLSSAIVLPIVAVAMAVALAPEAVARPGDRMAARRLQRLLPPGSTVVVPRPDEMPVVPPMSPRQARRLARREPMIVQPPAPTVVVKPAPRLVTRPAPVVSSAVPAPVVPPLSATIPLTVPPAAVAAPAPPLVRQVVPATPATPAPPVVVDRAGGAVPAAPPAVQTGAWTLGADGAAADGTQSVLVPGSPAEPVELLPTPAPAAR